MFQIISWIVFAASLKGCVNNDAKCMVKLCSWEVWGAWSDCGGTSGGGTRTRTRDLCCWTHTRTQTTRYKDTVTPGVLDLCLGVCGKSREGLSQVDRCRKICHSRAMIEEPKARTHRCSMGDDQINSFFRKIPQELSRSMMKVDVKFECYEDHNFTKCQDAKVSLQFHGDETISDAIEVKLKRQPSYHIPVSELRKLRYGVVHMKNTGKGPSCFCRPRSVDFTNTSLNTSFSFTCSEQHRLTKRSFRNRYFTIITYTADIVLAGASKVLLRINGEKNYETFTLHEDFFQGKRNSFTKTSNDDIGVIKSIKVRSVKTGVNPEWLPEKVLIKEEGQRTLRFVFSRNDWVSTSWRTSYPENGCDMIKYCADQICDTCDSCISSDSSYIYQLSQDGRQCIKCRKIRRCERQVCGGEVDHCKKCEDQAPAKCRSCERRDYCARQSCDKCEQCIDDTTYHVYKHEDGGCKKCARIANCDYHDHRCGYCRQCDESDKRKSLYWVSYSKKQCRATCSHVKGRRCWPGSCSVYLHTCSCTRGFRQSSGSCILNTAPTLLTCYLEVRDAHGKIKHTKKGSPTTWTNEGDVYTNMEPSTLRASISASRPYISLPSTPLYITETKIGIVNSQLKVYRESVTGSTFQLSSTNKMDGCAGLKSSDPKHIVTCRKTNRIPRRLSDGERLCATFRMSLGGFFGYSNFSSYEWGKDYFSSVSKTKTLCFRYDNTPPVHCSMDSSCSTSPLLLSSRRTRVPQIHVKVSGWVDPYPRDREQASGVAFYNLYAHEMLEKGPKLDVNWRTRVKKENLTGSDHSISISVDDEPALYAVYLEVHDAAGNVGYARRFFLYDNSSMVNVTEDKQMLTVSASSKTKHEWQINHGHIRIVWVDRFYNDFQIRTNYLKTINPDTNHTINGIYEQNSGILPVTGTPNVHGIISFRYQYSRNNGTRTKWKLVPNFTSERLSLDLTLRDGETYEIWIESEDIMRNSFTESVVVHIDSSHPHIDDRWLVREGTAKLFVHNNTDLSTMIIQFNAFDVHSGIHSVRWQLGVTEGSSHLGTGSLPVIRLKQEETCPTSENSDCYCPDVGPCEYKNYTVTLNSLIARKTDTGQHNRDYHFTFIVTNIALLESTEHLEILVDQSPPEVGVLQEGAAGGPDIDFTSNWNLILSWSGFVDHESGIREYIIGVATKCLTASELMNQQTVEYIKKQTRLETVQITFPATGKYFTSMLALNNAMEASSVICSDGVTFDLTQPIIENIELHQARAEQSILCSGSSVWLVHANLTMTKLPPTPACVTKCDSYLPMSFPKIKISQLKNKTSTRLCKTLSYFNDSLTYIPHDMIILNWTVNENNSQLLDSWVGFGRDKSQVNSPNLQGYESTQGKDEYRLHRAGFGGSTEFFIFIKVENKAGLATTVTLGPVLIDDTPPVVNGVLKPEVFGASVRVTWTRDTFIDPEQSQNTFRITYRAVMDSMYVSPLVTKKICSSKEHFDCFEQALSSLQEQDSELGKSLLFEMHVYNSAGHFTTVRTESIVLPSRFPPGAASVLDLDPDTLDTFEDVDFQRNSTTCIHWFGFHHHNNVSLEIGVGSTKGLDDIVQYQDITDTHTAVTCVSSDRMKPFKKYFTSVRATSSGGSTISSSDGFVYVVHVADALIVSDGPGCDPKESYFIDEILANIDTDYSLNVKDKIPFDIGTSYSLLIHKRADCELNVTSQDVLTTGFHTNSLINIEFVALLMYPTFNVSTNCSFPLKFMFYSCVKDSNYQFSTSTYSMNWRVLEPYSKFATNYQVDLLERICNTSTDDCLTIITETTANASQNMNVKFTELNLLPGRLYIGAVRPCFGRVCLRNHFSNGIVINDEELIGNVLSTVHGETKECTNITLKISDFQCVEPDVDRNFSAVELAITRSEHDSSPVTPWKRIISFDFQTESSVCITLPIHSYQNLFSCIHVICASGQLKRKCVLLQLNSSIDAYHEHTLFELPLDDPRLVDLELLLHSKYLGSSLKRLHAMDVDFIRSNSRISGAITNSYGFTTAWYLMKDWDSVPSDPCDEDVSCVMTVTTDSGFVRFDTHKFDDFAVYYICAYSTDGENEFRLCGNGFVVDDMAPIAGNVKIASSVSGFITDTSTLYITWSGFRDVCPERARGYTHGIKAFSVSVGSYPGGENVKSWTRVGDSSSYVVRGIEIRHGQQYFAKVRAEDYAGHTSESVSPGVVADLTPPVCGEVWIEELLPYQSFLSTTRLIIHLRGVHDPESGVAAMHLFIPALSDTRAGYMRVEEGTTFVSIEVDGSFDDFHEYQIQIQVTNRVGLHSTCKSRSFRLDNSPPEAGTVRDGNSLDKDEVDYQTETTRLESHWTGFSDAHSGIHEYRVGLGMSPNSQDVQPLHSVGLTTNFTFLGTFVPGVRYFTTVEACNQAGLCTRVSSDGVIMDASPPVAGRVLVGHSDTHDAYHGHRSYLYSHWFGFEDPESGIHHFECCISLSNNSCEVMNFTNTARFDYFFATSLNLPSAVPLLVTVRAINPVGQFVESTSPSFQVDDTPPKVITSPVFVSTASDVESNITAQWENSLLRVKWKFADDESPIQEHVLTFKTHHQSAVAEEAVTLGPVDNYLLVLDKETRLQNGDRYEVSVSACNTAGLCTTAHSPSILIDSTPPLIGGFTSPLTWRTFSENASSSVNLTWFGFSDTESNITSYHMSIGRTYEGAELTAGTVIISHDPTKGNQSAVLYLKASISQWDSLIVLSIVAENAIGLFSAVAKVTVSVVSTDHTAHSAGVLEIQRHSCDVHYCTKDCTCAVIGWKCRPPSEPLTCHDVTNDTSYPNVLVHHGTLEQSSFTESPSLSCLTAHWEVRDHNVSIRRFEWSMGLANEPFGAGIFNIVEESVWYDVGKQTFSIHCLPYPRALVHSEDYVVYVRAWFSETHYSISSSTGVRVDHSPPAARRGRGVKDSDRDCQEDYDLFTANQSSVFACWDKAFQESQTRIVQYEVWAGLTRFGNELLPRTKVGTSTSLDLPMSKIVPGTKYYVGVRAINSVNMATIIVSDGFIIDADPPIGGHVYNTKSHHNRLAQSDNASLGVSWNGFQDHHSSLRRYHVKITEANSYKTLTEMNVTLLNSLKIKELSLDHGKQYIAVVEAEDAVGHTSDSVHSLPIMVDVSPPSGFCCVNFCKVFSNITSVSQVQDHGHFLNQLTIQLPENASHYRIEVTINKTDLEHEQFELITSYYRVNIPMRFDSKTQRYFGEHEFRLDHVKSRRIAVRVRNDLSVEDVDVSTEVCDETILTQDPQVIKVTQIQLSHISVCAHVIDPESGLKNVQIGVGTTMDGFQIQTLKHTISRFHELVPVNVPHGTPVYVSVIAENHAGLKTYFTSKPLIIDKISPTVKDLKASLNYFTENTTHLSIKASWLVSDGETLIAYCKCAVGHYKGMSDLVEWVFSNDTTSCEVPINVISHGELVYISVQCFNTLDMDTVASADGLLVLLRPPSTSGSHVHIISHNRYSQRDEELVQSTMSSLRFEWVWGDQVGVDHFQCRASGSSWETEWRNVSLRFCEFSDLKLTDGGTNTVEVRAVNRRKQMSGVVSAVVVSDSTTPTLTEGRVEITWKDSEVILDYSSVFHHLSGRLHYTVNVGSHSGYTDYLRMHRTDHDVLSIPVPQNTAQVFVSVKACAPVGTCTVYSDVIN